MANPNPSASFVKGDKRINREGRPKAEWTWSGLLKEAAEEELKGKAKKKWIAESLFNQAIKGNVQAIKEFGDRVDGKPAQNLNLGNKDGEPLKVVYTQVPPINGGSQVHSEATPTDDTPES